MSEQKDDVDNTDNEVQFIRQNLTNTSATQSNILTNDIDIIDISDTEDPISAVSNNQSNSFPLNYSIRI